MTNDTELSIADVAEEVVRDSATRSLKKEIEVFVRDALANEESMTAEKLVRLAYAHFSEDEWMREQLIRYGLSVIIPDSARKVRWDLRTKARRARGSEQTRRERIESVFEDVGKGVSKSILKMTRPDHIFAAEKRKTRAAGEMRWAGLHEALADEHTDDTTTTGELPPARIAQIWAEHIENND